MKADISQFESLAAGQSQGSSEIGVFNLNESQGHIMKENLGQAITAVKKALVPLEMEMRNRKLEGGEQQFRNRLVDIVDDLDNIYSSTDDIVGWKPSLLAGGQ